MYEQAIVEMRECMRVTPHGEHCAHKIALSVDSIRDLRRQSCNPIPLWNSCTCDRALIVFAEAACAGIEAAAYHGWIHGREVFLETLQGQTQLWSQ